MKVQALALPKDSEPNKKAEPVLVEMYQVLDGWREYFKHAINLGECYGSLRISFEEHLPRNCYTPEQITVLANSPKYKWMKRDWRYYK